MAATATALGDAARTTQDATITTESGMRDETSPLLHREGSSEDEIENPDRPKGLKFAILFICILLGDFVEGYDTSCVATLTPVITDHFNAISDVGWYGIAYLLASCSTMLIYGQLYSFFSMKGIFIVTFLIFTIGTAIAATAQSSTMFILGRAISGLGSAGVFAGGSIIVANTTSLKHRPIYQAMSGGMESIALAFGPVISGAIASYSSWRVSFYMIIPMSIAIITAVFFFVHNIQRPENAHLKTKEKVRRLDLMGFAIYVPMAICLILGLQWAGIELPWDNWRIILLLGLAGGLLLVFLAAEYKTGEDSMFPLKILRQRSTALACAFTFCNSALLFVVDFYLPVYFQAVRGASTRDSGLMYLPNAAAFTLAILAAGPVTSYIGYYTPVMVLGTTLSAISTGLITTFSPTTPAWQWITYQILFGAGVGLAFQQPYTAIQTILPESMVPRALVTLAFSQEFGGIIALSIAQNVFVARLSSKLALLVPGLDRKTILDGGTLGVIDKVPLEYRDQAIAIYNGVIMDVFSIAVVLACLTVVGGICIEWRSVKEEKKESHESSQEIEQ